MIDYLRAVRVWVGDVEYVANNPDDALIATTLEDDTADVFTIGRATWEVPA